MIVKCRICGKEFKGRANSCICSGACRLEAQKEYQKKYRLLYSNKVKDRQRKWWNDNRAKTQEIKRSDNIALANVATSDPKPKKAKKKKKVEPKYTGSKWAEDYTNADRLTKISMLSKELSKYDIAHVSYGVLSTLWDSDRYEALLHKVLRTKEQEEQK